MKDYTMYKVEIGSAYGNEIDRYHTVDNLAEVEAYIRSELEDGTAAHLIKVWEEMPFSVDYQIQIGNLELA